MAARLTREQQALVVSARPTAARCAHAVAKRFPGCPLELEEMRALAEAAATEAVLRFEPNRGAVFSTFAWCRMYGAIIDAIHQTGAMSQALRATAEAAAGYAEGYGEQGDPLEDDDMDAMRAIEAALDDHVLAAASGWLASTCKFTGEGVAPPGDPNAASLAALEAAMSTLDDDDARFLRRAQLEGVPIASLAAELGTTANALYKRRERLFAALRTKLARGMRRAPTA